MSSPGPRGAPLPVLGKTPKGPNQGHQLLTRESAQSNSSFNVLLHSPSFSFLSLFWCTVSCCFHGAILLVIPQVTVHTSTLLSFCYLQYSDFSYLVILLVETQLRINYLNAYFTNLFLENGVTAMKLLNRYMRHCWPWSRRHLDSRKAFILTDESHQKAACDDSTAGQQTLLFVSNFNI